MFSIFFPLSLIFFKWSWGRNIEFVSCGHPLKKEMQAKKWREILAHEISLDFPYIFFILLGVGIRACDCETRGPGPGYQKPIRNTSSCWNINFPVSCKLWIWNNFHYSEFVTDVQMPFCPWMLWYNVARLNSFCESVVRHLKWNSKRNAHAAIRSIRCT